jgi:hypothetical protein
MNFDQAIYEGMAAKCPNYFEFVMALIGIGVTDLPSKKIAVKAWNKIRPEANMPMPRDN